MAKRIVTGRDAANKSIIVEDAPLPRTEAVHLPGFSLSAIWATAASSSLPAPGETSHAQRRTLVPGLGETSFMFVSFPPASVFADPSLDFAAITEEQLRLSPGIAEAMEPNNPGMHTTDTIDYGIVLDGEICLELDDGQMVELKPGDVVIQNGTRHAWRNLGTRPATLAFVLIGAHRGKV